VEEGVDSVKECSGVCLVLYKCLSFLISLLD
jgi:hypothetical protein